MASRETAAIAVTPEREGGAQRSGLPALLSVLIVALLLYFGREVCLPLAIATLIAFALSPLVSYLRNRGLPLLVAVLAAVTVAFAVLGLFLMVVAGQIGSLAENLPTFQSNILQKLEALQSAGDGSGVIGRVADMLGRINAEISSAVPAGAPAGDLAGVAPAGPVAVELVERRTAVQILQDLVLPLISPVATAGLVIVVVIFMLLEREDLRDRVIRLIGSNDLHRTTEMLEDAGSRVASYLLVQLLVNVIYAIPIGLGLWAIGVPNAVLWGSLTLVLRFVPYIGSFLAAAFPLFLAFAASPDWSMMLWTAALFAVMELLTSNVVEPWLYGSRTGLSPLAIIVSAIIWTSIWGPLGLILSTPLTVCLVVLGRHLPQFEVFDVLFGDEPVLVAHQRLYQRLLSGDVVDVVSSAEETLEESYLTDYYQDVCIPALLLAQRDYDRGVLTEQQEDRIGLAATALVGALDYVVSEELAETAGGRGEETVSGTGGTPAQIPEKAWGTRVAVVGGRSRLDDVAARMLGQTMIAEGAEVRILSRGDLIGPDVIFADKSDTRCLILNFLTSTPSRASLLIIRRIKRAAPGLRVGVVFWQMPGTIAGPSDGPVPASFRMAEDIGADFVVIGIEQAMVAAFSSETAKAVPVTPAKVPRKRIRDRLDRVPA
jgi:predicted PurR-regulated permease PerM